MRYRHRRSREPAICSRQPDPVAPACCSRRSARSTGDGPQRCPGAKSSGSVDGGTSIHGTAPPPACCASRSPRGDTADASIPGTRPAATGDSRSITRRARRRRGGDLPSCAGPRPWMPYALSQSAARERGFVIAEVPPERSGDGSEEREGPQSYNTYWSLSGGVAPHVAARGWNAEVPVPRRREGGHVRQLGAQDTAEGCRRAGRVMPCMPGRWRRRRWSASEPSDDRQAACVIGRYPPGVPGFRGVHSGSSGPGRQMAPTWGGGSKRSRRARRTPRSASRMLRLTVSPRLWRSYRLVACAARRDGVDAVALAGSWSGTRSLTTGRPGAAASRTLSGEALLPA